MPAVTFNNTQNVGFIIANTAAPRRNLDFSVPPGDAGDGIIIIASANSGTVTISMNVPGYGSAYSVTDSAPHSGNFRVAYKVSNGRETTASVKTDGGNDVNINVIAMRVKGAHRIVPAFPAVANTSADGVDVRTFEPTQIPLGDNSLLVLACTSQSNTAFSDSDIPAGSTLIGKSNTPSNSLIASFIERPFANNFGTQLWSRTIDRKRAIAFSIMADTETAGIYQPADFGGNIGFINTTQQMLMVNDTGVILAKENEEIGEIGVKLGTSNAGDGSGIDIAIYDVTNGFANCKLMGSSTITGLRAINSTYFIRSTFYPPIKLVKDRKYAVALKTRSSTNISILSSYWGTGYGRLSSQVGSDPFPSSWDFDSGTTADSHRHIFASVRNTRKIHISSAASYNAISSNTTHTSQFRLDPGASRKIVVMGFSEDQSSNIANCRFDGEFMTLHSNISDPGTTEKMSTWYYDIPDSGVLQDFTTYTEFDPGSDLTLTGTNQINIDTMTGTSLGETGYRLDLGAADRKTGDFKYRIGPINITSAGSVSVFTIFIFSQTTGGGGGNNERPSIQVRWSRVGAAASNSKLELVHFDSTTTVATSPKASTTYEGPEVHLNVDFYLEVSRVGSSAFCSIYTDNTYKNLIRTLTLNNLSEISSLRYVYFGARYPTGTTSTVTATIKNAYYMVGEPGNKLITMSTVTSSSNASWHAWQVNRANPGPFEASNTAFSGLGVSANISAIIETQKNSMMLATVASSSPARIVDRWNDPVILERLQLDEPNHTTGCADKLANASGSKNVYATFSGTEGNKYLSVVSIAPYKSKNKVKSGFVG